MAGSPLSETDVAAAFAAHARARRRRHRHPAARHTSSSPFAPLVPGSPARLGADSVGILLGAMAARGVRKIVVLSAQGTADSFAALSPLHKALFRWSPMRHQFADHDEVDKTVRRAATAAAGDDGNARVDFVLVRPVMMVDGPAAEVKDHGDDGRCAGLVPKISRASVASFIVEAGETDHFVGRSLVISN